MSPSLPNTLTISRIAMTPLICVLVAIDTRAAAWVALALFVYACITDFADGVLARRYNLESGFGRFLDPIADKVLVGLVLLVLVGVDRLAGFHMIPVAVILAREIVVPGLRQFLAERSVLLPSSQLAKWKTGVQMIAMGFLIIGPYAPTFGPPDAMQIGTWGLWLAAVLTAWTGWDYLKTALRHTGGPQHRGGGAERVDPARDAG